MTKLNADGSALVYSTLIGGSGDDKGNGIAIDSSGDVYITGKTNSHSNASCTGPGTPDTGTACCTGVKTGTCVAYPTTAGAFQPQNNSGPMGSGTTNGFVTKLNPTGSALVYSTYLGGSSGADGANHIAVDSSLNAYVTGGSKSTDFPTTKGAFQTTNKAATTKQGSCYVTELNAAGSDLVYSTFLGGTGNNLSEGDSGDGIAVDSSGHAYVTGSAYSADFPTTAGAFQTTNNSATNSLNNAFITKVNVTGTGLDYSSYLGGSGGDSGNAITIDSSGNAYVTGQTSSTDFPTTPGAFQTTNSAAMNGGSNAFITKLNGGGSALDYSTYLGGSSGAGGNFNGSGDQANGIAVDSSGNAYVTGIAVSDDFPVTMGAFQTTNKAASGGSNAFVAQIATQQTPTATATATATSSVTPTATATATATGSATPTATATATATGSATATATATATKSATPTATATATATRSATPTATTSPTPTASPTPVAGKLTISPTTLSFGTVTVNSPKVKMMKITNAGKISRTSTPPSILVEMESTSGSPIPSPFSVTTQCSNDELRPSGKGVPTGETFCNVSVQFKPTQAVSYSGMLTIFDNLEPSEMQAVPLSGKGKAAK